tara:strand:- start:3155 stop:3382 length:228 start_codon:yes stop_codon:yes gene_type:complete
MKEIKKNSSEIIRIEPKEYKGNEFIDIRVFFQDKDTGEYRPTKKGISFNPRIAQEVVEGIIESIEKINYDNFETN